MQRLTKFGAKLLILLVFLLHTQCSRHTPDPSGVVIDVDAPATITAVYETVVAEVQAQELTAGPTLVPATPTSVPSSPTPPPTHDMLTFAGYDWQIKSSSNPAGPGPNIFSNRVDDVYVDDNGQLHLKITEHDGQWVTTEVINTQSLGYGAYTFYLATPANQLDPNAVLGLFTWDKDAPEENYREIDIEISQWGDASSDNAQYVVQPWEKTANIHRFDVPDETLSTHQFYWLPDCIIFQSFSGHPSSLSAEEPLQTWTYEGEDIPTPGAENVRINLWLRNGDAPLSTEETEVIISNFVFSKWDAQANISAPANLQVRTTSTTSLDISWESVAGAVNYSLFRSEQYDGEYILLTTMKNNEFADAGLEENQLFFYRVEAEDQFGSSSVSSSITWGVPTNASQNVLFVQFDGEYVTGKVFYNDLAEHHRIVWWVLTDKWYIQPWLDDFYTPIGEDNTFRRWGHPGNRARVYLVEEGSTSPLLQVEVNKES